MLPGTRPTKRNLESPSGLVMLGKNLLRMAVSQLVFEEDRFSVRAKSTADLEESTLIIV